MPVISDVLFVPLFQESIPMMTRLAATPTALPLPKNPADALGQIAEALGGSPDDPDALSAAFAALVAAVGGPPSSAPADESVAAACARLGLNSSEIEACRSEGCDPKLFIAARATRGCVR